jgi:molybdate transport system substrate-binding protein
MQGCADTANRVGISSLHPQSRASGERLARAGVLRGVLALAAALLGVRPECTAAVDAKLSIAAAANFVYAMDALNTEFKRTRPVAVATTVGASGNLFAQIRNGAPFDLFLSADTEYPRRIVEAKLGEPSSLSVFASGRLVVWTTNTDLELSDLATAVRGPLVRKVAIAQPRTAPYGRAAQSALEQAGVWRDAAAKLVLGESVSQTAQFVETGNADLGLVPMSIVLAPQLAKKGQWKEIPPSAYAGVSLDHAAVLTKRGAANSAAQHYLEFLRSDAAKKILRDFGYTVP